MRSRIPAATLVLLGALCGGLVQAAEPVREDMDQTYPLAANGRVALDNINGDVRVEVWDRAEVRVQAVKTAGSREALERVRIEVAAKPSSIKIATRYPEHQDGRSHHDRVSVTYTITVPKSASLDKIDLVNGRLETTGVAGDVVVELVNGDVRVSGSTGNVSVETVNGRATVEMDTLQGAQRVKVESVNGTVELRAPEGSSATVEAETVSGRISNDFGLAVRKHEFVGRDMKGTVGGGEAMVKLETVNGAISLLKR